MTAVSANPAAEPHAAESQAPAGRMVLLPPLPWRVAVWLILLMSTAAWVSFGSVLWFILARLAA